MTLKAFSVNVRWVLRAGLSIAGSDNEGRVVLDDFATKASFFGVNFVLVILQISKGSKGVLCRFSACGRGKPGGLKARGPSHS